MLAVLVFVDYQVLLASWHDLMTNLCCAASSYAAVFFTYTALSPTQGFFYMGIMVIGMTALYMTIYFPQW